MRMTKKIIAIALSVLMAVSMMPFTVFAAALPTATVTEIDAPDGLEAAYLFKANDDEDSVQNSAYKDYLADFVISFDQDITENDVKVGGAYAAYDNGNWQIFNAPALAAGQEYRLLQDGVSAMLGRDISMTYEEICTIVKEFKCGIAGLNAAGITANVKLNLYKTADSEPITIESGSISYTFPEAVLPTATVTEIEAPEGLDVAYKYVANNDGSAKYDAYLADFVISFDKAVDEGDVKLGGAYDAYEGGAWQIFDCPALAAGQEYHLLAEGVSALLGRDVSMTYEEIKDIVQEFRCGVAGLDAAGVTMTVKLNLYETADSEPIEIVSGTKEYTFEDDTLPTATVTEIEAPEGLDVAYKYVANNDGSAKYDAYLADFVISFDKDIAAGDVQLGGAYDAYEDGAWQIFDCPALAAGQEYHLLSEGVSALLGRDISMTYEEIKDTVQEFRCGVAGLDAAGVTMTVKLNLYETADSEPIEIVSGTKEYTFPEELSLLGTVEEITKTAVISNNGTATVQAIVNNATINYSDADASIGRTAGYWAGINIVAPNGMTDAATYTSNGGASKSFAANKDGDNYMGAWLRVPLEDIDNCLAHGGYAAYTYVFDWNGDGTNDQTIKFYLNCNNITLIKDNQQVYPAVADDEFQVTVEDTLDFTLYIADSATADHVEFVFNGTPDVEENNTAIVTAYDAIDGFYDYSLNLAPAQIKDDITVTVYDANDAVVRSFTTSVADYCLAMKDDATYGQLAKAIYDYGKAAAAYFSYNADAYTDDYNFTTADFSAYSLAADDTTGKVANVSYVATSEPALRFIMNLTEEEAAAMTASANIGTASFVKVNGNVVLQVKDIPASKLGETITVTVDGLGTVTYTPIIYAKKAAANNDALGRLGVSIANYNQAAAALA
ncbi:MAG: hypothetical protein IJ168_00080 [Eubacterium sp.]|nr:hypothetical protein [Eubacterium sp.]